MNFGVGYLGWVRQQGLLLFPTRYRDHRIERKTIGNKHERARQLPPRHTLPDGGGARWRPSGATAMPMMTMISTMKRRRCVTEGSAVTLVALPLHQQRPKRRAFQTTLVRLLAPLLAPLLALLLALVLVLILELGREAASASALEPAVPYSLLW